MLPKSQRLSVEAFKEVIEKGQSFHSPFLISRVLFKNGTTKFAVSVPKKVAKTAVLRNKMKRRIYSLTRKFSIKPNLHIIFILKTGSTILSMKKLYEEMHQIFVKSSLIK